MLGWIKGVDGAYKIGVGIVGTIITGGVVLWGAATKPIEENTLAIEGTNTRIDAVEVRIRSIEEGQREIGKDLQLVRCWVKHEIEGTDASVCLVGDGER